MKRFIVLGLCCLLTFASSFAGKVTEDTVSSCTADISLSRYAANAYRFGKEYPQEKVYLQFDNTSYYTGETIWFKAFVVNASTHEKAGSKVLYVDLLSPDGTVLKQQKLKIENGQADGSFSLLDGSVSQARAKRGIISYPSGFYEIRAYTSYMLNFSEDIVFSRVFAVYEKPKEEGGFYNENPIIKQKKSELWELRPKTEKQRKINCTFYPEGGHLVMGKPCRVAFKVTDETGFGVDATGIIKNNGLSFSTVHDGMGCFTFIPQEYRNQVEITVGNNSGTFNLPSPENIGLGLYVDSSRDDSLLLKVDCTTGLPDSCLGMTLTCRGELLEFCTFALLT